MKSEHDDLANAIEKGDAATVQRVLQGRPDLVNSPDWVPPPLHCAVLWDQPEIATLLLDHGANIEMLDPDQQTTPLRYAVVFCKPRLIPLLIDRGANAGPIQPGGTTALELAIEGSEGAFEEYEDLPRRDSYLEIVELLHRQQKS